MSKAVRVEYNLVQSHVKKLSKIEILSRFCSPNKFFKFIEEKTTKFLFAWNLLKIIRFEEK